MLTLGRFNCKARILFYNIQHRFIEVNISLESLQLLNQTLGQLFASQIGKARNIQNLLFWI